MTIPHRRPELAGGYKLIEFLLARAAEEGEKPPACALEWQDIEILQMRLWGKKTPAADALWEALWERSKEASEECREAAQRWSTHPDFEWRR